MPPAHPVLHSSEERSLQNEMSVWKKLTGDLHSCKSTRARPQDGRCRSELPARVPHRCPRETDGLQAVSSLAPGSTRCGHPDTSRPISGAIRDPGDEPGKCVST